MALCREEIENIDWECNLVKLYRSQNSGMYVTVPESLDFVLSRHEGAVVLEDDCIPDKNFFDYLRYVDRIHQKDPNVVVYAGHNPVGKTPFFKKEQPCYTLTSRYRSWGYYIKSHFWEKVRNSNKGLPLSFWDCSKYAMSQSGVMSKLLKFRMLMIHRETMGIGDIFVNFIMIQEKKLSTLPLTNHIKNIGDGDSATHTKKLPSIKFRLLSPTDYSTKRLSLSKVYKRVEILDGWLLII